MTAVLDRLTKPVVVLLGLASSLALAGTTALEWLRATAPDLTGTVIEVPVPGQEAAPAVMALGLVGAAASLASALSSVWVRWVTGPVLVLTGATAAVLSAGVFLDPEAAARAGVARATGLLGGDLHATTGTWPLLAVVPAVLVALAGLAVLVAGGRWRTGSRYRSAAVAAPQAAAASPQDDPAAAWDALTRGQDPTEYEVDPAQHTGPEPDRGHDAVGEDRSPRHDVAQ